MKLADTGANRYVRAERDGPSSRPKRYKRAAISKAACCIMFAGEPKMRTDSNEVHVKTLIATPIFAQSTAAKVFKVYSPALFVRRVGCKVMLSAGRALANSSDVLPDFSGQIFDMVRVPRIVLVYSATFGDSRRRAANQKAKRQQKGPNCHSTVPSKLSNDSSARLKPTRRHARLAVPSPQRRRLRRSLPTACPGDKS